MTYNKLRFQIFLNSYTMFAVQRNIAATAAINNQNSEED